MAALGAVGAFADAKLRVLCLHGYAQSAETFRNKTGSLRKALKSRLDFVYIDAPHDARPMGKSWFMWEDLPAGAPQQVGSAAVRPSGAVKYSGWEASRAAIEAALAAHHPVHGLLGFSQGATAAAIFCAGLSPEALRFSVHISGFLPRDADVAATLHRQALPLPSLHLLGAGDDIIPVPRSLALAERFGNASVHQHPGRHMVPTCSGEVKDAWLRFLDGQQGGRGAAEEDTQ